MLKSMLMGLACVWLCEASISGFQLVVADDSYSALTGGILSSSNLGNPITSLSNDISEEHKSSQALSEESNESIVSAEASSDLYQTPSNDSLIPTSTIGSLTKVKPATASRGSLLISTLAQASDTSAVPLSTAEIPVRSSANIQHRILPAEIIPLPITISTRPGLRTVIAPETITIQQPGIAKVGEVVQHIPTAVSHHRQTVVHNHARVVTPIVAPAVRTLTSQIVRAYHTPLIYTPHVVKN